MFQFELNGKTHNIDNRLQDYADAKIIPDLKKRDKDGVFLVDGKERIGKSVFAQTLIAYIAYRLETPVNLDNICMTPLELRKQIQESKKNTCIIYDEAHRGMASSRALSEINNILKDLMMEMGQKNLFVIIVLPSFFLLDKYAALFRSVGLFHVYELKGRRGYWCFFNEKNKLKLYLKGKKEFNYNCMKWPRARGRFYNEYVVDEEAYRKKKADSFTDKARLTKQEAYMEQRNAILYLVQVELDVGTPMIEKLLRKYKVPLKQKAIYDAIQEVKDKLGEIPPGVTENSRKE